MRRVVILFVIFFLWNIQTTLAQTTFSGSMKIYITWIKIKAEKEKKNRSNLGIGDSAILLPCKYKKTDYLNGRFSFSNPEAGNTSIVQVRNSSGAGKEFPADDFILDLHMGKSGNNTGFQNPSIDGVTDAQSLLIDGAAAVAGTIIIAAIAGASGGNPEIDLSKAHVHRKETPPANNNEKVNSLPRNGMQLNEPPSGFSFAPLRDTVVDIDGNVYHTAALGAMVLMTENLRVTRFHNGKEIPTMKDSADLSRINIPAYYNYRSDSGITAAKVMLYNWYAVNDSSGICPKNWHLPSYAEWTSLITCLGGANKASEKMKEHFSVTGKVRKWWSYSGKDTGHAQSLYLDIETREAKLTVTDRNSGLAVRCIRDY